MSFALLKLILGSVATDRTVQAGSTTSGISLWGGLHLATSHGWQDWVAAYATVVGALGATAVLVYTVLKIVRLLKNPHATE